VEVLTDTTVLSITKEHEVYVTNTRGCSVLRGESLILGWAARAGARRGGDPRDAPRGIFTAGTAQQYINLLGYSVGAASSSAAGGRRPHHARRMTLEGAKVLLPAWRRQSRGGARAQRAAVPAGF
jgi:hypothetical protein